MQDNKNYIDNRFINDSWKSLRSQLDAEMPVEESSDRSFIYLLSTILLISLGSLAYMSHLYFNRVPVSNTTKEVIKYQKVFVPYYMEAPQADRTLAEINEDTPNSVISNTPLQEDIYTALDQTPVQDIIQTDIEFDNAVKPDISDVDSELVTSLGIESLQTKEPQILATEFDLLSPEIRMNSVKRKLGLLNFYFSMQGFVSNLDYTGYSVESGIQLPLSKVLSFQTGVSLAVISRDFFVLPFIEKPNDNNLKQVSSQDLDDADTYYEGLQGFNQIVIPMALTYKLNKRFNIQTGVKLRYTYSESIDRVLKSRAQQKISKDESVASSFFNNSNLGIFTGISYELSDHVSLSLDTEWGFHSLINNKHLNDHAYRKYDLNLITIGSSFKF